MQIEVWTLMFHDDEGIACSLHPSYEAAWADLLSIYARVLAHDTAAELAEDVVAELLGDAGVQYRIDSVLLDPAPYRQVATSSS